MSFSQNFLRRMIIPLQAHWGLVWRGCLSCIFGFFLFWADDSDNFDSRLRLRGPKALDGRIHIIQCENARCVREVILSLHPQTPTGFILGRPGEFLGQLPKELQEKATSPAFVFLEQIESINKSRGNFPTIQWATDGIHFDQDGKWRRMGQFQAESRIFAEAILGVHLPPGGGMINFPGTDFSFLHKSFQEYWAAAGVSDIVLVTDQDSLGRKIPSPIGLLSSAEAQSQVIDQFLKATWIQFAPFWIYGLILIFIAACGTLLFAHYPLAVATVLLLWFATLFVATSFWLLDSHAIWIPILSPMAVMAINYVLFLGYRANVMEKNHWELAQSQTAARELEKLKNNFVSLISHDLRTPLAKIQNATDRLQHHPQSSTLKKEISLIQQSSEELNRYIQSILRLLRIESRDFELHLNSGDLNEEISSVVQQVGPLIEAKEIEISLNLEPLFAFEADWILIREVVLNLLDNAIKYSLPGGTISIATREEADWVFMSIQDSGKGISPQEIGKVWQKFVRGEGNENTTGSGLGLYLVKYFVEIHGGQVQMLSQVGKGTEVRIALPLKKDPAPIVLVSETERENYARI